MKEMWFGIATCAALLTTIVFFQQRVELEAGRAEAQTPSAQAARVLLFADPHEADEVGGCGEIFGLVRSVARAGTPVREIDPRGGDALIREHRVVVQPTVLLLDDADHEVARFEGEDAATIAAMASALKRLPAESLRE